MPPLGPLSICAALAHPLRTFHCARWPCKRGRGPFTHSNSNPTALLNSQWQRSFVALIRELLSDTTAFAKPAGRSSTDPQFSTAGRSSTDPQFSERGGQAPTHNFQSEKVKHQLTIFRARGSSIDSQFCLATARSSRSFSVPPFDVVAHR